ncbi:ATP-dependent helicase [Phocaeicola vulgatus]|nr:ATP-dependent helicase [Phocaeicola vulgatus]
MFVWGKNDLNPEQEKAIYNENSILLIACPGSGKTRTITYKIAYELSKLESNKQYIIAITYTNRAADEIKERIELLGVDTEQLWIGTIHSFCVEWILKPYHMYIEELKFGYDIINTNDTENYLVSLCDSYSTPKKKNYILGLSLLLLHIGRLEDKLHQIYNKKTVESIICDYYQILKEKHEIDYELILYYSYCLLKENQSICKTLSNIFPYILIDEYQDTKELQYVILGAILKTGKDNKAFIVGDPNQSIYGNLGGFPMDKAQLENVTGLYYDELSLSYNYRSSSLLVSYFDYFKTYANKIEAVGKTKDYQSVISYNKTVSVEDLENEIVRIIKTNIDEYRISPNEICILAPQWIHLSGLTRNLMARLPQYSFDGPGMAPFARDIDNFWYKLSRIILTDSTPGLYIRRLRWASEIVTNLLSIGVTNIDLSAKQILYICNSISINEQDGLEYLKNFFDAFLERVNIDINQNKYLKMHYDAFLIALKNVLIV